MKTTKIKFKRTELGMIPEDWEVKKLGDAVTFQRGYDLPIEKFKEGKYPVIKSNGLAGYHSEFKAKSPGVLLGRSGKIGEPMFIDEDYWPHNTTLFSKEFHQTNPKFIYYLLKTLNLGNYNAGSAVPTLNRNHIHPIPIAVPPLCEQSSIAKSLSDLDSKIELNQQMNKALEAVGQAIFKHWFVEFEFPNEEGKPYKSSGGEMVYNKELGKSLPVGWRQGSLGEVADNPRRGIQAGAIVQGTAYIGLEHMPRRSIALSDWGASEKVISNKFRFYDGEILFGKLRPYFHKVGVAPVDGVCSTDILVIVPKSPEWHSFVLFHVSSEEFVNYTDATSTGTRMPRSNWEDMSRYELVIPPVGVVNAFNEKIAPLVQKIRANILQSRILAEIRNPLLPELMSGKIRVPVEAR